MAAAFFQQGDSDQARPFLAEAVAVATAAGDRYGLATAWHYLGKLALDLGDYDEARELTGRALAEYRELGRSECNPTLLNNLGYAALKLGELQMAKARLEEGLSLARGNRYDECGILGSLAALAAKSGDYRLAALRYADTIVMCHDIGDQPYLAEQLQELADVATQFGEWHRSARLQGAATALRRSIGTPPHAADRDGHDAAVTMARRHLGDDAFAAAFAAGCRQTCAETVDEVLTWASELAAADQGAGAPLDPPQPSQSGPGTVVGVPTG